jgi:hypothetical protein
MEVANRYSCSISPYILSINWSTTFVFVLPLSADNNASSKRMASFRRYYGKSMTGGNSSNIICFTTLSCLGPFFLPRINGGGATILSISVFSALGFVTETLSLISPIFGGGRIAFSSASYSPSITYFFWIGQ